MSMRCFTPYPPHHPNKRQPLELRVKITCFNSLLSAERPIKGSPSRQKGSGSPRQAMY